MRDLIELSQHLDRLMIRLKKQDEAWLELKNEITQFYLAVERSDASVATMSEIQARFTRVYTSNRWLDDQSRSGPGSRQDSAPVIESLQVLERVVDKYRIESLIDCPCGDMNWISDFLNRKRKLQYAGLDIVDIVINRNKQKYPDLYFEVFDIVSKIPPMVDLIFCKDLLIHLNDENIVSAVTNMIASGSTYMLISNNFGRPNSDLMESVHGDSACRYVDLTAFPFGITPPLWNSDFLGLWRIADTKISYLA